MNMEFLITELGVRAAAWFGFFFGLAFLIRRIMASLDEDCSLEKKAMLSSVIRESGSSLLYKWVPNFLYVFDKVFGQKHLSWKCFVRSAVQSIFLFTTIACVLWNRTTEINFDPRLLIFFIGIGMFSNILIDYASLLQTRFTLSLELGVGTKLVIDIIATTIIALSWSVFIAFFYNPSFGFRELIGEIVQSFKQPDYWLLESVTIRASFYTTYFTSILLWLYGFAHYNTMFLSKISVVLEWLDTTNRPIRAIGLIMSIYVIFLSVCLFPIVMLI